MLDMIPITVGIEYEYRNALIAIDSVLMLTISAIKNVE